MQKPMFFVCLTCFCYFNALLLKIPKMVSRWLQEPPKRPQERPKSLQDGPKSSSGRAQAGPKTALWRLKFAKLPPSCHLAGHVSPSCLQVASKMAPRGPKRPPEGLQEGPSWRQESPRGPQETLKRLPRGPQDARTPACILVRRLQETGAAVIRRQAF